MFAVVKTGGKQYRVSAGDVIKVDGGMLAQQRSATVDIVHPDTFPALEDL